TCATRSKPSPQAILSRASMTCCPGHSLRDVRTPEASKLSQSIATKLANFFASYRIRLLRGIRPLIPMGLNHRLRTYDELWQAVGHVCDLFSEEECLNFFIAAGYEPD